jgi:hypothetical protein
MSTINGFGTRFYSISDVNADGACEATFWVTAFYLPIFPLWTGIVKRDVTQPKKHVYQVINKIPLNTAAIIKTYLLGWLVLPALILIPFVLCIPEVIELLGLPTPPARNLIKGDPLNWVDWLFIGAIVYNLTFILLLRAWYQKRGMPKV